MEEFNIKTTCYNNDEDCIRRLHRVQGALHVMGNSIQENILAKIESLYDDKGTLEVTWIAHPAPIETQIVINIWESMIGDGGGPVKHIYKLD